MNSFIHVHRFCSHQATLFRTKPTSHNKINMYKKNDQASSSSEPNSSFNSGHSFTQRFSKRDRDNQVASIRHGQTIKLIKGEVYQLKKENKELKELIHHQNNLFNDKLNELKDHIWEASNRQMKVVFDRQSSSRSSSRSIKQFDIEIEKEASSDSNKRRYKVVIEKQT